jgi:hypothetical protein
MLLNLATSPAVQVRFSTRRHLATTLDMITGTGHKCRDASRRMSMGFHATITALNGTEIANACQTL